MGWADTYFTDMSELHSYPHKQEIMFDILFDLLRILAKHCIRNPSKKVPETVFRSMLYTFVQFFQFFSHLFHIYLSHFNFLITYQQKLIKQTTLQSKAAVSINNKARVSTNCFQYEHSFIQQNRAISRERQGTRACSYLWRARFHSLCVYK